MAKTIIQEAILPATPEQVYDALMDSDQHSAFTGAPAEIDARVGGQFKCYGEHLSGVTVELVPGKRIVQAWRGDAWAEGDWSVVIFEFAEQGGKTRISFRQYGVPDDHFESINEGWQAYYWDKMEQYFQQK